MVMLDHFTDNATQELLRHFRWEILEHPPYSPDLAPSDYHLFLALKEHVGGHRFQCDEDVNNAVKLCLNTQDTSFYQSGIGKVVQRLDKCLNRHRDYVKKLSVHSTAQCVVFYVQNRIRISENMLCKLTYGATLL